MVRIRLMVRRMRRPLQLLLRWTRCSLVHQSYALPRRVLTVGISLDRGRRSRRTGNASTLRRRSPPG